MKQLFFVAALMVLAVSCVKNPGTDPEESTVDIAHFATSQEFDVPTRAGHVTLVKINDQVVAETDVPMTITLPAHVQTRSLEALCEYLPYAEYPNYLGPNSQYFQVVCFEDSRSGDYDYNDLVIHVKYQASGDLFGFGVQPVALGSVKSIKLGCVVYKGTTQVFNGLITPEGKDCRAQHFESKEGFVNTVGNTVNWSGNGGNRIFLGSTMRNWNVTRIPGSGSMSVEWFIEVDNGQRLYALSTHYLKQSFDKNNLPYGLVITNTGSEFRDEKGSLCGYDWFNYPKESVHIKEVYPELWTWMTTSGATYDFAAIYDGRNVPAKAFPASSLGVFLTKTTNVLNESFLQN